MEKIKKRHLNVNSVNSLKAQLFTPETYMGAALGTFCEQSEQYIKEKYQTRAIRYI